MSLHLLELPNIRSYNLLRERGDGSRQVFTEELKTLLDRQTLYVEEAVVIHRNHSTDNKIGEYLRSLDLIAEEAPLEVVFLPVHKPVSTKPTTTSHASSRVEVAVTSAHYIEDPVAEYLNGKERVRFMYEDGLRKGQSLIVYEPVLRAELFEALGKLGATAKELQKV